MSSAVIELRGIERRYQVGEVVVRAIRGLDLRVEEGEFISVMGPSGSGKSTLMNIIGCLDRPSAGSYLLEGLDTGMAGPDEFAEIRNARIGFVFQGFNLLSRTSALENVELPLFYSRRRPRGRAGGPATPAALPTPAELARAALEEVGLGGRLDHHPSQLSGGQQQRVAIARAMVNDPAFILADEPTGNLDTEMSLEIMSLFQALHERGKTIVMVTHEPEIAAYTERIVAMRDGALVSDRPVDKRRSAAEDLAAWKEEHALLAAGEGRAS